MFEIAISRKSFVRSAIVAAGLVAALAPMGAFAAEAPAASTAADGTTVAAAASSTADEATTETNWAYAALPMDANGIGTVYYTKDYYDGVTSETIDPTTSAPYAEGVVDGIVAGADASDAQGYVAAPQGAVLGISAYDGTSESNVFWYDADNAAKIFTSADPLAVNPSTGEVTAADGTVMGEPMNVQWAFGAIAVDSEQAGVGTVYYTASYFNVDDPTTLINPLTTKPYTADEVQAIQSGATAVSASSNGYVDAPANATLGISAFGSDTIFWYDADAAAQIVTYSDPLTLNAATGELTAADGTVVAEALAE